MNDSELNNLFEILKRILDKRHLITIYKVEENGNENNSKNDIDTAILEAIFKASAYNLSKDFFFFIIYLIAATLIFGLEVENLRDSKRKALQIV